MPDALNIPKMLEAAFRQELVDAGVNPESTFLYCFQSADPRDTFFPTISIACSPDIPDGSATDSFFPFRRVHAVVRIGTLTDADADRATLSQLYVQVRTALNTANNERNTWQTGSLTGCALDAIEITDCPVPTVEVLNNGQGAFVMEVNFDALIHVT